MKRVLIVSQAMEIGGAEKALLGLLNAFDCSEYKVDLFLMRHTGELMKFIPDKINLLPQNKKCASLAVPFSEVIGNRAFGVALGRYIGKKAAGRYIKKNNITDGGYVCIDYSHRFTRFFLPKLSDEVYDLAISFLTPHYFVAEKVKAKTKIAWIHTDYSAITVDKKSELPMWSAYDKIASISPSVTDGFLQTFPSLADKIVLIENIHPASLIRAQSLEFDASEEIPKDGSIRLLSVGRYTYPKNFDNVPDICRRLVMKGLNVKWYIIGYGGDEELIKEKISQSGMTNRVILLGKKINPYPYFRECDFYIQPSRYEGNAVTVNEALILGKAVAVTDYPTAKNQIKNGCDGVIVPLENEACADGLVDFILDAELQNRIKKNVAESDYSKSEEINKLYGIVEENYGIKRHSR